MRWQNDRSCNEGFQCRFTIEPSRSLARLVGISQRRLADHLRVTCAKAAEYQRRRLVHFHAVIRLDAPDPDQLTPPPGWATFQLLEEAIRDAAHRVGRRTRTGSPTESFESVCAI